MQFECPPFAVITVAQKQQIRYVWDDTRASMDFTFDPEWVLDAALVLRRRAQMVLCVGLYEWVVWRFDGLHNCQEPVQIAKAAWCATVNAYYFPYFELDRSEWTGPIKGPLWCAATWLQPALTEGDENETYIEGGLDYLTKLAMHVAPNPADLSAWLKETLTRLAALFPGVEDDPFVDLFNERVAERRGELIGREVLDPTASYVISEGKNSIRSFIAQAMNEGNPFIAESI
jgi:hypothetical protein